MRSLLGLAVLASTLILAACSSDGGDAAGGSGGASASATNGSPAAGPTSGSPTSTIAVGTGGGAGYGDPYAGGIFNLGPVDYQESAFHNACAPQGGYPADVQQVEGSLLAGLWNGIPNVANYCDACIYVTTAMGKTALLRVVTYGDTSTNSIDVSPDAYALLNSNEDPRSMTWQFTECPQTGPMLYEFQTGSSEYWTSLWVRNARVPLAKVEVQSPNHGDFVELERGSDGTLTDNAGFGNGMFTIRSTGVDGSQVTDTFMWPGAGIAGAMLTGQGNFN